MVLVLLGVALIHGEKYFRAGRMMYKGERLVQEKRYSEALPYLKETLKIAPRSDKAVLLTAKAALLTGDTQTAGAAQVIRDRVNVDLDSSVCQKGTVRVWRYAGGAHLLSAGRRRK